MHYLLNISMTWNPNSQNTSWPMHFQWMFTESENCVFRLWETTYSYHRIQVRLVILLTFGSPHYPLTLLSYFQVFKRKFQLALSIHKALFLGSIVHLILLSLRILSCNLPNPSTAIASSHSSYLLASSITVVRGLPEFFASVSLPRAFRGCSKSAYPIFTQYFCMQPRNTRNNQWSHLWTPCSYFLPLDEPPISKRIEPESRNIIFS